jgi:hypothetical protein
MIMQIVIKNNIGAKIIMCKASYPLKVILYFQVIFSLKHCYNIIFFFLNLLSNKKKLSLKDFC